MIIACPKCNTKFNVPDELASPLRKAKCSFCGNIFVLADGMDDSAFERLSAAGQPGGQEQPDPAEATLQAILDEGAGYHVDSVQPKKRSKTLPIILGLLLLAIIAAGVLYITGIISFGSYQDDKPADEPTIAAEPETNATQQNATALLGDEEPIKDIIFQNTKQYFVNNEKLGQIFVVEGKTINNYRTPKELIRVEANLLDEHGTVVASKQQFCGVTLTMFQLQILSEDEIEKALNNNIEILANNLNIQPGGAVSFMIVFVNPPPNISTLFLKVVEVKDSPGS